SYGLFSAFGMYLGHFLAWICAGAMGAAAALILNTPLTSLDAGEVAWQALGISGVISVIIAGWATSNPTLYRAGLALQAVTPGWPRWVVTLLAGTFTTAIACFPFVFGYLLEFVALFGILLVPVGAIVFMEHWLFPKWGLPQFRAERQGLALNVPALVAWGITVATALVITYTGALHMFFLALPLWVLPAVLYTVLTLFISDSGETAEPPALDRAETPKNGGERSQTVRVYDSISMVAGGVATISLIACFILPIWLFLGDGISYESHFATYQQWLAVASVIHLVSAATWVIRTEA
ncbi:MAG: nucleoside transporter, partial [Candidatus Omnitrophica bacterium]|nr:nucleoside transporter [Candidatus Omnitrophota bacterium]